MPRWLVAVAALPVDGYTIAAEAERQAILAQVRDCDGNLTQAARRLGIARSTLYLRLAKYGRRPALTN